MPVWEGSQADVYAVATFRTLGTAATPQNIFSIENPVGSTRLGLVTYIGIAIDSTAALATVAPSLNVSRPAALPTGGTVLTAVLEDTEAAGPVTLICRGGTASDGGVATAITATAGASWRTGLSMRLQTAVGQMIMLPIQLIGPQFARDDRAILRANQSLLVQGVLASAATTHFIVVCRFKVIIL